MKKKKLSLTRIRSWLHRNKATLMSAGAGIGVVSLGIVSSKEGAKAYQHISELEETEGRKASAGEKARIILKDHIWAMAIGASTVGLIFGADKTHRNALGAMSGAYALLTQKYNSLLETVKESDSPEQMEVLATETLKKEYKTSPKVVSDGMELWYEDHIGYFEATEGNVYKALAILNDSLKTSKCAIFADFVLNATSISEKDIAPLWWASGWSYEAMEAAWNYEESISITESPFTLDDGLKCKYISFSPGILPDVCTEDGSLVYYVSDPLYL